MASTTDDHASSDESSSNTATNPSAGVKRKRRDTEVTNPDHSDKDSARHQCPHCERSFGRVEHMRRHATSHSDERPFRCSTCEKAFHRLDTMQRHELIHKEHSDPSKPRGSRACTECALAKVRCPGGQPCDRCDSKQVDCRYPEYRGRHEDQQSPEPRPGDQPLPHQPPPETPLFASQASPPDVASVRSLALTSVPFSPVAWHDDPPAHQPWLPPPPLPAPLMTPRTEPHDPNLASRALSFGSTMPRPTGLTPLPSSDPYSNLRQAGFVTGTPDNASIGSSGTRNWLETLLAPQPIDMRDAGTPDTNSRSHRTTSISETYLDGDGARLPKIGIHRRFNLRPSLPIPAPGPASATIASPSYGFPSNFCHVDMDLKTAERRWIDQVVYNEIRRNFQQTCGPQSTYSSVFESSDYPSWDHMQMFIQIYLDEFQPLVPVLHLPTLNLYDTHWMLSLAIASMGCHLADMPEAEYCALGLNEHLRRAINDLLEAPGVSIDPLLFAQIKLLNCIGMVYCGDERMEAYGWRHHLDVIKYCRTDWLIENVGVTIPDPHLYSDVENQWRQWKEIESRRRTGYAIWMLDCMWNYGYTERNLLTLEDATVPVPCQEVLWEAESALQWQHVKGYSVPMPSLCAATHSIYIEKRVEPTMGEFSRILLIHALYSASWAVQSHLGNPLSHWTPRAVKQDLASIPSFRGPIWLPSEPNYFRWRNATCDCLDILHWRANAVTGAASGIEHPTLLHLHLARIVLLTPLREIVDLASGLTRLTLNSTTNVPSSPAAVAANRAAVRRWAEHDQPKARLAMYHAGVLFWHVRLYSAKGFYEPSAVLLAALALWAFGAFAPKQPLAPPSPAAASPGLLGAADDEASFPTSINIDRPADDEIVQMYIRRGDRMQALIVGVGDIRSAAGPQRVLLEGAKLASSLANWGSSRRVMRVLVTLARVVKDQGVG